MQYFTALILAAAITGTQAVSIPSGGKAATVILRSAAQDLATQTSFGGVNREESGPTGSSGPYESVELNVNPQLVNKALRCQILDKHDAPIVVTRGANVDVTFSDADKGPWKFQKGATKVVKVICDPAFKPAAQHVGRLAKDTSIRVTLTDGNLATQTPFKKAGLYREMQSPVGSSGPFNSVTLSLGKNVQKKDLRCQVLDERNRPITVQRGKNVDVTFADGNLGPWKFLKPTFTKITKIICDPAFIKKAQ
ncbi:hypothetical protein NQ176_g182 [Zarea fungicola]|uniref:Uncharacterized protein n=1 Tax=Zarea fungicola TaxID=93591 RepID=A0ACC1NYU3_9HYPO|nr:hypothetical protein NQ176_g182 [Lecanicillium fungicola]